jgi:hypothetical protein
MEFKERARKLLPHAGGSIPLEALRLGCEAFASDLNPDADAEIEPVPTSGGGYSRPEPELDRLSNILKGFNDQLGSIPKEGRGPLVRGRSPRRPCRTRN